MAKKKLSKQAEQNERERAARNSRAKAESVKEIGPIPAVVNPERRAACEHNLDLFLRTYFPQQFYLEPSEDQLRVIKMAERIASEGGLFALAMPRSSGKTTICLRAMLWSLFYAKRRYGVLISATGEAVNELLIETKTEIETNDLLLEDFPEICFPIRALEGESKRCTGQMSEGQRTQITYKGRKIVFPTVKNSKTCGTIIQFCSLTGRLRGMKSTTTEGRPIRPDIAILDDPQTDATAASDKQNERRERILSGAVLGLCAPGTRMAALMPTTVIRKGDMADRILNKILHPEWNGERCRLVYQWGTNQELWDRYAELRIADLRAGKDTLPNATKHYRDNHKAMSEGFKVAWPARYEPHQVDAIQYAMDLKLKDPDTFDAEYQNDPKDGNDTGIHLAATAEAITLRVSGYDQKQIPDWANHLVASVDVQGNIFYWLVLAVGNGFTANVVDYGTWPDQGKNYFTIQEVDRTIQRETGVGSPEAGWLAGLRRLESFLLSQAYRRDDGTPMNIEKIVVDANFGKSTNTVYSFVRQTEHKTLWLPWHGKGIAATQAPINSWPIKPGDIAGEYWRIKPNQAKTQEQRHIIADTNYWKSFVHSRLMQPDGERGALMLFKGSPMRHRMLADHWTAEKPEQDTRRGKDLTVWFEQPARDNHLFDCIVMAYVAASVVGCSLKELERALPNKSQRKSLAQMREDALRAKEGR